MLMCIGSGLIVDTFRSLSRIRVLMNFIHIPAVSPAIFASWANREQQKVIESDQAQLDAMMETQGKKRLLLTDDQRRLLASKASPWAQRP